MLLLLAICPTLGGGTRPATGSDWPRFLGPTGDSVSTEKGMLNPWPEKGPKIVWQLPVGDGYAMPSIARGKLYLFDREKNTARLRAINSETGQPLWEFTYPTEYKDLYNYSGGPRCCPVIDNGLVTILGPEGLLHCLNADDGKPIWKFDTTTTFGVIQNFFGVGATPVVEGDLLLVMVGGSPKGSDEVPFQELKNNGTAMVAFEKKTGKIKWKSGNDLASYATPIVVDLDGRRTCLAFCRAGLLGLAPETGEVLFEFPWRATPLESVNAANPVVVGNRVLISETYGPGAALLEIKNRKVNVVWSDREMGREKSMQAHWATPVYRDGHLYGCSGRHTENAEFRCIEWATGKVLWSEMDLTRTSFLLVEDNLIVLGEDGTLRLVKATPKKYTELSRVRYVTENEPLLRSPCWAAPLLSHGLLYVRGKDRLLCLDLKPIKGN